MYKEKKKERERKRKGRKRGNYFFYDYIKGDTPREKNI